MNSTRRRVCQGLGRHRGRSDGHLLAGGRSPLPRYRDRPAAEAADFEETAYLLLSGALPTRSERDSFAARLAAAARSLDPAVIDTLARLAAVTPDASPMDALHGR